MAVLHVVLQKAKPDTTPAFIAEWTDMANNLKNQIPELQKIHTASHVQGSVTQGYDLLLYAEFASQADVKTYAAHPAHEQLVQFGAGKFKDAETIIYDVEV